MGKSTWTIGRIDFGALRIVNETGILLWKSILALERIEFRGFTNEIAKLDSELHGVLAFNLSIGFC